MDDARVATASGVVQEGLSFMIDDVHIKRLIQQHLDDALWSHSKKPIVVEVIEGKETKTPEDCTGNLSIKQPFLIPPNVSTVSSLAGLAYCSSGYLTYCRLISASSLSTHADDSNHVRDEALE